MKQIFKIDVIEDVSDGGFTVNYRYYVINRETNDIMCNCDTELKANIMVAALNSYVNNT